MARYRENIRPSIDLDKKGKAWYETTADRVLVGAIIPDLGEVVDVVQSESVITRLSFKNGDSITVLSKDKYMVFQEEE